MGRATLKRKHHKLLKIVPRVNADTASSECLVRRILNDKVIFTLKFHQKPLMEGINEAHANKLSKWLNRLTEQR